VSSAAKPIEPMQSNDPSTSEHVTVRDAFRSVLARQPDRLALRDAERSITYREFDLASNKIANALVALGDDRPIVLVAPQTIESIVLMWGCVKAGRLVVPLDPRWPIEQWLEVARATDGRLVVPDETTRARLGSAPADAMLGSDLRSDDDTDPDVALDPDAPITVLFTSGSTGTPKGTIVGHQNLLRGLDLFDAGPTDRLAIAVPLGFMTGAQSSLGIVLTGASGHLFDLTARDITDFPAWLASNDITLLALPVTLLGTVASLVNQSGRPIDSLRWVSHGGEAISAQHLVDCRRAFPTASFRYGYGMTETGWITDNELVSAVMPVGGVFPAGRPSPAARLEIVDDDGQPVPDGEEGEIWVTAPQVALGYWKQPALTAERFIFHADGTRTVRTGDRGRLRSDGTLEVCGRMDRRVKVNGQLVDLSVVEQELQLLAKVRDAIVSSVPTDEGGHRVVAHVVLDENLTVGQLRRGLASRVPPYALPKAFFRVDDIPQTANGKADRVWLRESAVGALPLETEYVEPRDDDERAVAQLFAQVLAVDRVGVHDDFFELGGDSLSVVDLLAGLSEELHLDLPVGELLRAATVEAVAARLGDHHRVPARTVVRVNDGTGRPLFCVPGSGDSPVQYRPLGRRLPDVAVYAFAYRGMDARAVPDHSVEAIARRNVTAMRAIDPLGPYRLLGYSFGGAVALAMAHQLVAAGQEVELVALLEPSVPAPVTSRSDQSRAYARRVLERTADANPGRNLHARLERAGALAGVARRYITRQLHLASAGIVPRRGLAQHHVFQELHTRLSRHFSCEPYRGRVALIASPKYIDDTRHILDHVIPRESMGGQRRDIPVNCEHIALVREPNVAEIARALDALLASDPRQT
jgi:amino acid adenylation domain-containing protein